MASVGPQFHQYLQYMWKRPLSLLRPRTADEHVQCEGRVFDPVSQELKALGRRHDEHIRGWQPSALRIVFQLTVVNQVQRWRRWKLTRADCNRHGRLCCGLSGQCDRKLDTTKSIIHIKNI